MGSTSALCHEMGVVGEADGSGIQQRGGFVCKDNLIQSRESNPGMQTFFKSHEVLGDEDSWARMFGQEGLCCPACPALAHPLCLCLSHWALLSPSKEIS